MNNSKLLFTKSNKTQHQENNNFDNPYRTKSKAIGIIAVANGAGIAKAFAELGADEVINASENRSPSAYDFLECAERIGTQSIIVFPNNKNYILSVKQAANMTDSYKICVIPTKSIAEGYSALSLIDKESDNTDEVVKQCANTIENMISGYVFIAAKDTKFDGIKIKRGDALGYSGSTLITKSKSITECATKLLKKLSDKKSMLTVFKGINAKDEDLDTIKKRIKKSCPELEIYVINSGQAIFDYIFGVE